jgi:regulator of protease activity HflC (stomatin/prohibitin superfamily)
MSVNLRRYAAVLESEAEREAAVNRAEGVKQKVILEATAVGLYKLNAVDP